MPRLFSGTITSLGELLLPRYPSNLSLNSLTFHNGYIFLRNVAYAASDMDVQVALVEILHRPPFPLDPVINFHVELLHRRGSGNHSGVGISTFPTISLGETLLRSYDTSGLSVKGWTVYFSQSNRPLNRGVVERLLSPTWEDPLIIQEEGREHLSPSPSLDFPTVNSAAMVHG